MLKQIQRIERLHQLIRLKATGSPQQCAKMLDISERQLYNTLDLMKALRAPVYFDNSVTSYSYEHEVECSFGFSDKTIDNNATSSKPEGGVNSFISRFFSLLKFYSSEHPYTCVKKHTQS